MGERTGNSESGVSDKWKLAGYAVALIAVALLLSSFGFTVKQALATTIVLALILGTVLFWEARLSIAFIGTALLFASGLMTVSSFIENASLNIILFLAGMMIVVGYLEKYAFFEFALNRTIRATGGGGKRILLLFMVLAALLSALVDEVTSVLFMLSIMLCITRKLKVNPVPFVIMTVFATNIGSSATAVGNPVGVIIAISAKLSFMDFLVTAAPIAFACLVVATLTSYFVFRRDVDEFAAKARKVPACEFVESADSTHLRECALLFAGIIFLLALHVQIEQALGLEKNTMLLGTSLIGAGVALLLEGKGARQLVDTKIDWWTLLFFMFLFASVGALEESGVIQKAAAGFVEFAGGSRAVAMGAVLMSSGLLSSILDNVLAVAVFIPIIHDVQALTGFGSELWWSLLFGAVLFGNMTIIGSTANIVALGMLEKRGLGKVSFMEWLKPGIIVVAVTAATSLGLLYLVFGM
ncbi:Na(+)/H(+) antiporter NhaB [uncultured archaeon]|nr:Na(+)/H(+) antiporter NhaB [uncultured archaeon]